MQTTQLAETLPKNTLEAGIEAGFFRIDAGVRYGVVKNLDAGVYYCFNLLQFTEIPQLSFDMKYQLTKDPEAHFVFATGAGYGIGTDWLRNYIKAENEDNSNLGLKQNFAEATNDFYLPLYFTYYGDDYDNGFYINPFCLYRAYEDHYYDGIAQEFKSEAIQDFLPGLSAGTFRVNNKWLLSINYTFLYYYANNIAYASNEGTKFTDERAPQHEVKLGLSYLINLNKKEE
ncbi:MAG: hypothetical protein H7Y00_15060 [Fimbriimonadaceae bacterium]|nr:hypothetical protein [Chitinophagales bacterium]